MAENIFSIPAGPLFSFRECHWFLHRNFDDCLHTIEPNGVKKALLLNGKPVLIGLSGNDRALEVTLLKGKATAAMQTAIAAYLADWFDMERDIAPFYQLLQQHPRLSYMAADYRGLRMIGIPDLFEALCWGIIGQQINLAFAYRIKRRLVEQYGTRIEHNKATHYLFPSCETLAGVDPQELKALQFSAQKAMYLVNLAKAFACGDMSKEKLAALPDFASRQKALTQLKGIGVWTANYALMKSLKEQASIPYGDAGLLNALLAHDIITQKTATAAIDRFFRSFAGWESYLVFYLWRSLAKQS